MLSIYPWKVFLLLIALLVLTTNDRLPAVLRNWDNSDQTGNIATAANWGAVPGVNDIAQFGVGPRTGPGIPSFAYWNQPSTAWTINQILFNYDNATVDVSTFRYVVDFISNVVSFNLPGGGATPGVDNQSQARQLIRVWSIPVPVSSPITTLNFNLPNASADVSASGLMFYEGSSSGRIEFTAANATASNANFTMLDNSVLLFQNGSTVGQALVSLHDNAGMTLSEASKAGTAAITITDNAYLDFTGGGAANTGEACDIILKNGQVSNNTQAGGKVAFGPFDNTCNSLNSDTLSIVALNDNILTITGSSVTMTINGSVTGSGGLTFSNTLGSNEGQRTTAYLLRDASALGSYTGPTTIFGNNTVVGNTTSLANSVIVNQNGDSPRSLLVFDQDDFGIFDGNITGTQTVSNAVTIQGGGIVQIPSSIGIPSGYTSSVAVPVTVKNATLVGDTGSLFSNITLDDYGSQLIFRQTPSGTFARNIFAGTNGAVGSVLIDSPGATITFSPSLVTAGLFHLKAGNANVLGDSVTAPVVLDNDTNLILNSSTTTFANNTSGSGAVQIANHGAVTTVTFSGVNSYRGGTLVGTNVNLLGNSLALQGNIQFSDSSGKVTFDQSIAPHAPVTSGVYSGNIIGLGSVVVQGGRTLTFMGLNNSYPSTLVTGAGTNWVGTTNTLQGNVTLASSGQITFNQSFLGDFLGNITGAGTMLVTGGGRLNLLGTNTFTGTITVASGTLEGNTASIQQNVVNSGTVQFTQLSNGTYSQSITGTGNLVKAGPAKLSFISPQIAANTYVREGELNLNTTLTGNSTVESGGILSGNGTVTGNLAVLSGGVLKPGNSIGTMNVGGNVTMNIDSQYPVQINGAGNATDTIAAGTVQLLGGEVDVTSVDGTFKLNSPYQIMHSNTTNGLTGTFSIVQAHGFFNPHVVEPGAIYDSQNAYIVLQTAFNNCPLNQNQQNIAFQLDNLTNPPADIQALLQELVVLPCDEIAYVFDEMSGLQYAGEMVVADMTNRQFIRRLFDPLRDILRMPPSCKNSYIDCCEVTEDWGHEIWAEVGGTRLSIDNGHEGYGLKANGYEVVGGLQHMFSDEWVVGIAAGYFQDQIHFNLPGKGNMNTVDVGLYGLYRPDTFYFLGDLTFGTTSDKVDRTVAVGDFSATMHSKTRIYQGTAYLEAGTDVFMDSALFGCVLVQPFAGIELGYAHRNKITEHQGESLNLAIDSKSFFKSFSRLGFHFNTMPELGQMQLALDIAWDYRIADAGRTSKERFIAFGTSFDIEGAPEQRSSFDGALSLIVPAGKYINLYFEVSGQKWQSASTGSAYGGIQANW